PFQLAGMAFTLAFVLAAASWLVRGGAPVRHLRQPAPVWLLGVCGLFGYHFFYFVALRNAPPVEASLIAYLWPLLIVLMSSLVPRAQGGGGLRWFHLAGALAGLAGTALIVTGGAAAFQARYGLGYAAAAACALIWSSYSVLSRRYAHVPSDAVGGFCGATAALAWACHLAFETTVWPAGGGQWLAVAGLGLGPVGLAFFTWDHGVKHGDIRVLGAASYAAPLMSTMILIAAGLAPATWVVGAACALIVGGALLAGQELLRRRG
ncbi:MAG: DMT family transporter, partial [Alphaproteobacteria bacterium]